MSDHFGKETPKLGFGLMRLPKKGLRRHRAGQKDGRSVYGSRIYIL